MIRSRRRGVLAPGEMFPASDPAYRVSFSRLRSGVRIRVVERGDPEATPVLLLHGWGCSAYVFRHNFEPLADAGFRAMAAKEPERVRLIDASGTPATVTARLLYALGDLLP